MHQDRMNKLTEVLKEVIRQDLPFNLQYWKTPLVAYMAESKYFHGNSQHPCGFAACAIGWYVTKLMEEDPHTDFYHDGTRIKLNMEDGNRLTGYAAIAEHFEIEEYTAMYLFCPQSYDRALSHPEYVLTRVANVMYEKISKS